MSDFKPTFTVKATGHVTAEFTCDRTASNIGRIFDWIRREKWKGCLQINFAGNGGVNSVMFAESPKLLKDAPQINN